MMYRKLISTTALGLGCALGFLGCAGEDEDSAAVRDEQGTDVGLSPTAFESHNGMLPTCFWSVGAQKTLRALGKGAIANAGGTMPNMPDISALCYDTIKYAVQCALDSTQSVKNPHNNAVYQGMIGLATNWRTQALDTDGRRWVTACMVQRLNALGLPVPILLEGDHDPLHESTSLDGQYPFEESSAFGDLFSSTTPLTGLTPAFTAYVCSEQDLTNQCLVNASNLLNLRLCDNLGLLCGVQYIGTCSSKCTANGSYWNCPNGGGYSQTIRVQTQDSLCL